MIHNNMINNGLSFDNPFLLFAFLIFIPIIIFDVYQRRKTGKLPQKLEKKARASIFFFRLFLAFVIIALAGPRWGTGFATAEFRRGLDVVFAIDVSRSMDVTDALPGSDVTQSRLERGLLIAKDAVISVSGVRFAAAVGRSRSYLAVPLVWDNEAVLNFIEALDGPSITGRRSTNLEALVNAAADAFHSSSAAQRLIVLISDGEVHDCILANALNRCVREGIIVTTVALGSETGGHVPGLISDEPVISRRNTAVMRNAAEKTGGIFIDGSRSDASSVLASHLLSISQETTPGSSRKIPRERRFLFIMLAVLAYGISKFIPRLSRLPLVSIIFIFIFTSCSDGRLLLMEANFLNSRGRYNEAIALYLRALNYEDAAPYAEYGLGLTFHSLGEGMAALNRYNSAMKMLKNLPQGKHRELIFRINYNSGIIFFEKGDYHSAAASFRDALRTQPGRIEAKRNLELSLISIARELNREDVQETQQGRAARDILFEYLRQHEQQFWRSREWAPEEKYTGLDF